MELLLISFDLNTIILFAGKYDISALPCLCGSITNLINDVMHKLCVSVQQRIKMCLDLFHPIACNSPVSV